MRERGHGRIVNVSSIGGKVAVPHMLPYCASKFALAGYSEGMRAAVKRDGVYVTTVCPGLMRTGSARHAEFRGKLESEYGWFASADSTPGLSIDAARAGRMIVDACVHGDAELIMPVSAWVGAKANALAPGITSDVLSLSEHFLPQSDGSDGEKHAGVDIARDAIPAWLASRDDTAAAQNNEIPPRAD
jgi:short-subunit dehydrogenase